MKARDLRHLSNLIAAEVDPQIAQISQIHAEFVICVNLCNLRMKLLAARCPLSAVVQVHRHAPVDGLKSRARSKRMVRFAYSVRGSLEGRFVT